jgi:energy-coupling factor transporter ATP-binding protein EcfA2
LEAPLLAVVGGSTGSGKSTLVNSLVGALVTKPGVLRPTTRHPVLVHHPGDEHWFIDDRVLPRLPRITGADPGPAGAEPPGAQDVFGLRLVARASVPAGIALLDAPDIDSVARANRELARVLMAAADMWLFVTTAARYSDAVPWQALRAAVARNAAVALVLNRVPPEAVREVTGHLRALLSAEGLADAPLFVVAEQPLVGPLIPGSAVAPLACWLSELGADAAARAAVARRTLDGALEQLVADSYAISEDVDAQCRAADRLAAMVDPAFRGAGERVMAVSADGSLLRGEVLARWQEFVGASATFRRMESTVARWRDRMTASIRGEPVPPERVTAAIESGLAAVLVGELAVAGEQVDAAWRAEPAGQALLAEVDLARPDPESPNRAAALVRDWQADVLAMIRAEGADRRSTARALAYGVNGMALTLIVLVFSATGGLTGIEVGIAGGSAVLAQKVLEAVFSEDAVRRLAQQSRDLLAARVCDFMDAGAARFSARINALGLDRQSGAALRLVAGEVAMARAEATGAVVLPTSPVAAVVAQPRRQPWWKWRP